jgi:lysophospholipase L1-like esterase
MGREKRSKFANDAKSTADLALSVAQNMTQVTDLQIGKLDKTGLIAATQIDKNRGLFDQTFFTSDFLQTLTSNGSINAVPANKSVVNSMIADYAIDSNNLKFLPFLIADGVVTLNYQTKILTVPVMSFYHTSGNVRLAALQNLDFSGFVGSWVYIVLDAVARTVSLKTSLTGLNGQYMILGNFYFDASNNQYYNLTPEKSFKVISYDGKVLGLSDYTKLKSTDAVILTSGCLQIDFITKKINVLKSFFITYDGNYYNVPIHSVDAPNLLSGISYMYFDFVSNKIVLDLYTGVERHKTTNKVYLGYLFDFEVGGVNKDKISVVSNGSMNANSKWCGKKWNAIGDSITAPTDTYHKIISQNSGISAVNFGINGSRAAVLNKENALDDIALVTRMATFNNNADLCTIYIGTNDWGDGIPLGVIDSTSNSDFYGAMNNVITNILTNKPTIRLALITPMRRWLNGNGVEITNDLTTTNKNGNYLREFVNAVVDLGEKYSLPVLNLYDNSGVNQLTHSTMLIDKLHPSTAGKVRLATIIEGFISSI